MRKLLIFTLLYLSPIPLFAQAWSGIIAPSRAIDWSSAGLPATLPDGETTPNAWTPPTRTQQGPTFVPADGQSTINAAIAACTSGHYILLGPGTYNFSLSAKANCTLRGSGADQTKITLAANGTMSLAGGSGSNNTSWTSGFSQGTTTINVNTITGAIVGQSHIILNGAGTLVDPGDTWPCANPHYCSSEFGNNVQKQSVMVVGCDGNTTPGHACVSGTGVQISPGIYMPNYSETTTTVDVIQNEVSGSGLEDLTIDCNINSSTGSGCFFITNTNSSWVIGCRFVYGFNAAIAPKFNKNILIMSNYFFGSLPAVSLKEIIQDSDSDDLIINNIFTDSIGGVYLSSGNSGNVYAYNYERDGVSLSQQPFIGNLEVRHEAGENMLLAEGNELGALQDDAIHGPKGLNTFFRNMVYANDPPYTKTNGINAITMEGHTRFDNAIGNVLGSVTTTGYKTFPPGGASHTIYLVGTRGGNAWPNDPEDFLSILTQMFWGNVDVQSGVVETRFCAPGAPGFSSPPCSSVSEVPTALNPYTGFAQALSCTGAGPFTCTATLSHTPCLFGDLTVVSGGGVFGHDNFGNGNITGTGIQASSTVNCSTGAVSIIFTASPSAPTINYLQQGGGLSSFANPAPASTTLPASFFLPVTAHPAGGTNLSFWKVCKNYTTGGGCGGTFQIQPFPLYGPDVTGGDISWNGINYSGHAYKAPARIAWENLPLDHSYQVSRSITAASWSSANGGTETYTINATSPVGFYGLIVGDFQVSGMSPAGCNTPGDTFFQMTSSTTNTNYPGTSGGTLTVSFAMPVNLGCTGAGTFSSPNIRVFNRNVYALDSSVATGPAVKLSGNVVVKGSVRIQQ